MSSAAAVCAALITPLISACPQPLCFQPFMPDMQPGEEQHTQESMWVITASELGAYRKNLKMYISMSNTDTIIALLTCPKL